MSGLISEQQSRVSPSSYASKALSAGNQLAAAASLIRSTHLHTPNMRSFRDCVVMSGSAEHSSLPLILLDCAAGWRQASSDPVSGQPGTRCSQTRHPRNGGRAPPHLPATPQTHCWEARHSLQRASDQSVPQVHRAGNHKRQDQPPLPSRSRLAGLADCSRPHQPLSGTAPGVKCCEASSAL